MADKPVASTSMNEDPAWSQVWHLPVLLLGLGLLVVGVYAALPGRAKHDFPVALDDVGLYLQARNLEKAELKLEEIQQQIDLSPEATDRDRARYWQYWGDLVYMQNHENMHLGTEGAQKNNRIVIERYENAETFGDYRLSGASLRRYAQTLLALGQEKEALAVVDQRMSDATAQQRYELIRSLIERHLRGPDRVDLETLSPLIDRFRQELVAETDRQRQLEQDIWITGVQAKLYLDSGAAERAVDYLLSRLNRLKGRATDGQLAPLMVLLAQAYQRDDDVDNADRFYRVAQQSIESTDPLNADILVGLARIVLSQPGERSIHAALEHYNAAVQHFPSEEAYVEALIGAADCEARLEAYPDSEYHFGLAVEKLTEEAPAWDRRRRLFDDVVRSHIDRVNEQGLFDQALAYLGLLRRMHEPDMPAPLLLDFAVTHENIAESRLARADRYDPAKIGDDSDENLDAFAQLNREAAVYFGKAAEYYLQHAREVTLDDAAHRDSLWKAALGFDKAQMWDEAIDTYAEFIKTRQSDPLLLRAKNHLGKALMAKGQYEPASEQFLELVREHPHAIETFDSLVPLSQAYIALGRNDAAVRGLTQMVDDHPAITPDSRQYREALIQLGKLFYSMIDEDGAFAVPAIERLSEAVERYADSPQGAAMRFLLADSYRKSIPTLDRELSARRAQAEIVALSAERNRRLAQAQMFYNQAINELEARNAAALSALEELYLRNAYFYQADCAFDRQRYEEAIDLYDTAARRWEHHPASLVALVQIVNARCELGQFQEAKVANDHALWQLERIPDEAFDDPALPMSREHWEDWLRWTSELKLFAAR